MEKPYQAMPDIEVLPAHFPIPNTGFLPVNAFVIKAREPVLVDTGMGIESEEFMKALNSGGVAFFQVPTYKDGYRFHLKKYLRKESSQDAMEMHVLPQDAIFEIVRKENGKILEVLEDFNTSWGLSNTFLVQKM